MLAVGKGPILDEPGSAKQEAEGQRKVGTYSKTLLPGTALAGAWSLSQDFPFSYK